MDATRLHNPIGFLCALSLHNIGIVALMTCLPTGIKAVHVWEDEAALGVANLSVGLVVLV